MIFDELRRQNADWYTQNPLLNLPDGKLKDLAERQGMTLEEFKAWVQEHANTPRESMTCPLCGKPQTHLSDCKGCGTGAFSNWDFEAAHGENAFMELRDRLQEVLSSKYGEEKAKLIRAHVYDCMVCADCWRETIQTSEAFRTCPLKLFADQTLADNLSDLFLRSINWVLLDPENIEGCYKQWLKDIWSRWIEPVNQDVAAWRAFILEATLKEEEVIDERRHN